MSCFSNSSCKHCEKVSNNLFDFCFDILNIPQGKVEKKNLRNIVDSIEVNSLTEWTSIEFLKRFQSSIDGLTFILRCKWWIDKCRVSTQEHVDKIKELFESTFRLVELYKERRKNFESDTKYIRINEYIIDMAKDDFDVLKNLRI